MQTNNAHEYTDEQLQVAVKAVKDFKASIPSGSIEERNLAEARAFLAALPKPAEPAPWTLPAHPAQSQQAWTPAPGDVVWLKSGGPEMTVLYLNDGDKVKTTWFDGRAPFEAIFPVISLTPSKEARP